MIVEKCSAKINAPLLNKLICSNKFHFTDLE